MVESMVIAWVIDGAFCCGPEGRGATAIEVESRSAAEPTGDSEKFPHGSPLGIALKTAVDHHHITLAPRSSADERPRMINRIERDGIKGKDHAIGHEERAALERIGITPRHLLHPSGIIRKDAYFPAANSYDAVGALDGRGILATDNLMIAGEKSDGSELTHIEIATVDSKSGTCAEGKRIGSGGQFARSVHERCTPTAHGILDDRDNFRSAEELQFSNANLSAFTERAPMEISS